MPVTPIAGKKAKIAKTVAGKKSPTVPILMGVPGSYLVATENAYIGNLVKLAGSCGNAIHFFFDLLQSFHQGYWAGRRTIEKIHGEP
ncbi:hypothetical protein GCM10023228_03210 [Brevibacillus fulvus]|uniref:Uncharacterized protein n=1 Tax=Brevibacillus fulvus TaxID=1125967 RepID=A0A939BW20_9BACL|nr:hypothetical protein [Brevibacillus fulvus]